MLNLYSLDSNPLRFSCVVRIRKKGRKTRKEKKRKETERKGKERKRGGGARKIQHLADRNPLTQQTSTHSAESL